MTEFVIGEKYINIDSMVCFSAGFEFIFMSQDNEFYNFKRNKDGMYCGLRKYDMNELFKLVPINKPYMILGKEYECLQTVQGCFTKGEKYKCTVAHASIKNPNIIDGYWVASCLILTTDKYFKFDGMNEIKIDLNKYPHKCPKCGNPAYIGFSNIDCSNCEN